MSEQIFIELTQAQVEKLAPLQDAAARASAEGRPGAIVGQVYPDNGYVMCKFFTCAEVTKFRKGWESMVLQKPRIIRFFKKRRK